MFNAGHVYGRAVSVIDLKILISKVIFASRNKNWTNVEEDESVYNLEPTW